VIFARPVFLYSIPLIIVITIIFQLLNYRRKQNSLNNFLATGRKNQLIMSNKTAEIFKDICLLIAIIFFLIAAAGPASEIQLTSISGEGIDILMALDISKSMDAGNPISKLEVVKKSINDLLENRKDDRFALIIFSGSGSIISPLTLDHRTIKSVLNNLSTAYTTSSGTSIISSLIISEKVFERDNQRASVMLLFSDGENFGPDYSDNLQYFQDRKIPIVTIGVGSTEGEPIPTFDNSGKINGYLITLQGDTAITYLEEKTLMELSDITEGIYVYLDQTTRINNTINHFLETFKKKKFKEDVSRLLKYHYEIPLGLAGIFITISLVLERFRRKKIWTF